MEPVESVVKMGGRDKKEKINKLSRNRTDPENGGTNPQDPTPQVQPKPANMMNDTTDMALFVRTSSETLSDWNRQRIVDALMRETTIDRDSAERISREVEEQIAASKISLVTAPLIR